MTTSISLDVARRLSRPSNSQTQQKNADLIPASSLRDYVKHKPKSNGRIFRLRDPLTTLDGRKIPFDFDEEYNTTATFRDALILKAQADLLAIQNLKDGISKRERLRVLNGVFDASISQFHGFRGILAEIKQEYLTIVNSLVNAEDECSFLRTKVQKLIIQNGKAEDLHKNNKQLLLLQHSMRDLYYSNNRYGQDAHEEDKRLIVAIGKLYIEELRHSSVKDKFDPKWRNNWSFVKDWIKQKVIADDANSGLFALVEKKIEDNTVSQEFSQPDVYRALLSSKADEDATLTALLADTEVHKLDAMSDARRAFNSRQKAAVTLNEKISSFNEEIRSVDQKIEELSSLVDTMRIQARMQREMSSNPNIGSGNSRILSSLPNYGASKNSAANNNSDRSVAFEGSEMSERQILHVDRGAPTRRNRKESMELSSQRTSMSSMDHKPLLSIPKTRTEPMDTRRKSTVLSRRSSAVKPYSPD